MVNDQAYLHSVDATEHGSDLTSLIINGEHIITGSRDKTIRVWDIQSGRPVGQPMIGHYSIVTSLTNLDDGKVISGSEDKTIRIWDIATGQQVRELKGHAHWVSSVVVDDGLVISASRDETIRVWDTVTGLNMAMRAHAKPEQESVDAKKSLLASHYDTIAKQGSLKNSTSTAPLPKEVTYAVLCLAVLTKGKVVSGGEDCAIRVWDVDNNTQEEPSLLGHTQAVTCIYVYNEIIISGSLDNTVRVWNVKKRQQVGNAFEGHTSGVSCVAVFEGKIISGSYDQTIRVWNIQTGKQLAEARSDAVINTMATNKDWIIVGSQNRLQWWNYNDESSTLCMMRSLPSQWKLHVHNCQMTDSKGLSKVQKRLVLPLGAIF